MVAVAVVGLSFLFVVIGCAMALAGMRRAPVVMIGIGCSIIVMYYALTQF